MVITAQKLFADTDVHITIQGKRHLGAAIGSRTFTEEYICSKVQTWSDEIKRLANVATTQPHAVYAAFTHGLSSRWLPYMRTIPDIQDLCGFSRRTLKNHKTVKIGGWAVARVWALAWDNTVYQYSNVQRRAKQPHYSLNCTPFNDSL